MAAVDCQEKFWRQTVVFVKWDCIGVSDALRESGINTSEVFPLHRKSSRGAEQYSWYCTSLDTCKHTHSYTRKKCTRAQLNIHHTHSCTEMWIWDWYMVPSTEMTTSFHCFSHSLFFQRMSPHHRSTQDKGQSVHSKLIKKDCTWVHACVGVSVSETDVLW